MFDADYYDDLCGRTRAVLIGVEQFLARDQASALDDLIDHNEPGAALEMIIGILLELQAPVTAELAAHVETLGRDMKFDEAVGRQVWALAPSESPGQ